MKKTGYDFSFKCLIFLLFVIYIFKKLGHLLKSVHQFGFFLITSCYFFFMFCIFYKLGCGISTEPSDHRATWLIS